MKGSDVRTMSDEELKVEPQRLRRQLYNLRSQAVTEKLENPTQIGQAKRDIARCLTAMNQRVDRKSVAT